MGNYRDDCAFCGGGGSTIVGGGSICGDCGEALVVDFRYNLVSNIHGFTGNWLPPLLCLSMSQ